MLFLRYKHCDEGERKNSLPQTTLPSSMILSKTMLQEQENKYKDFELQNHRLTTYEHSDKKHKLL